MFLFLLGKSTVFAVFHLWGKYELFNILLNNLQYSLINIWGIFLKTIFGILSIPEDNLFLKFEEMYFRSGLAIK